MLTILQVTNKRLRKPCKKQKSSRNK